MKIAKGLLLGSAAALVAVSGAQAADLPVAKSAPVEYVRIASSHGAGFFYIPGSDTAIKFAGRIRADYTYAEPVSQTVFIPGGAYKNGREQDVTGTKVRARFDVDTRTPTEFGTLRAFFRFQFDHNTGEQGDGVSPSLDKAYIQWAGITAGRASSFFDFYASDLNWGSGFLGAAGSDKTTNLLAYTATFGGGFSATISLEDRDARSYDSAIGLAGQRLPDVVGALRVDQDWGSAQLSGALHQLSSLRLAGPFSERVDTKYGWAVQGGVNFKLPALAAGDKLWLQAAYADGALRYLGLGDNVRAGDFRANARDSSSFTNAANHVTTKTTKGWNVTGGLLHYWTPSVRQGIWGSYTAVNYSKEAKQASANNTAVRDFNAWTVGSNVVWSPVSAFDIGLEVLYTKAEKKHYAPVENRFRKGEKSEDAVQARVRLQRDF